MRSRSGFAVLALAFIFLLGIFGCGRGGPRTHPVSGKIDLSGADVSALAGGHVDAALQGDPTVRASGEIRQDGTFNLQTLHEGVLRQGALEGNYRVRIVLNDDDPATRKRAGRSVARRYLSFETSGLSIQVPASSEVTLRAAAR